MVGMSREVLSIRRAHGAITCRVIALKLPTQSFTGRAIEGLHSRNDSHWADDAALLAEVYLDALQLDPPRLGGGTTGPKP